MGKKTEGGKIELRRMGGSWHPLFFSFCLSFSQLVIFFTEASLDHTHTHTPFQQMPHTHTHTCGETFTITRKSNRTQNKQKGKKRKKEKREELDFDRKPQTLTHGHD